MFPPSLAGSMRAKGPVELSDKNMEEPLAGCTYTCPAGVSNSQCSRKSPNSFPVLIACYCRTGFCACVSHKHSKPSWRGRASGDSWARLKPSLQILGFIMGLTASGGFLHDRSSHLHSLFFFWHWMMFLPTRHPSVSVVALQMQM